MIDNTSKLDFMVEILRDVVNKNTCVGYFCTFNYLGFKKTADCNLGLPLVGYQEAEVRSLKISNIMKKIYNDKVNYKKYLDDDTEQYLIKTYDYYFSSIALKYKVVYTKPSFPKGFETKVKNFVTAHNTFYVVGDILDDDINNLLVATDDLTQHIPVKRHFIRQLIRNADEYSFEQLNPAIKVDKKPAGFTEL